MPAKLIPKVFFDASVLFAAAYSASGSARDLIQLALRGRITLLVSQDILTETTRNLARKAPQKLPQYSQLLSALEPTIVADPEQEQVWQVEAYVAQKDAPIIAAAIAAQPDYFVTYDRKDLLDPPEVTARSGLRIVTPDVVIAELQAEDDEEAEAGEGTREEDSENGIDL